MNGHREGQRFRPGHPSWPSSHIPTMSPSGWVHYWTDSFRRTRAAVDAAARVNLSVLAWTVPQHVAEVLNAEFAGGFIGHEEDEVDLVVRVDRERQKSASLCHASQAIPTSVLWRRLELLGHHEHLRYIRR